MFSGVVVLVFGLEFDGSGVGRACLFFAAKSA
jgi:hypothetical protein